MTTSARAFRKPFSSIEAITHFRSWMAQPVVQMLDTGDDYYENVFGLLEEVGAAGSLVTGAQIAALSCTRCTRTLSDSHA